jgi:hypothetical protein
MLRLLRMLLLRDSKEASILSRPTGVNFILLMTTIDVHVIFSRE